MSAPTVADEVVPTEALPLEEDAGAVLLAVDEDPETDAVDDALLELAPP